MSGGEKKELLRKINEALESIRPHLAVDGGDVEVMDITDDMCVKVKWLGSCQSCAMSEMTMKAGVEQTIKSKFPQIETVIAVNEP